MLRDLRDVYGVEDVLDLEHALMLEAFASGLGRRVDAPLFWGESSLMSSSLSKSLIACSQEGLVAKGQTCALFLLLTEGAWSIDCLDIRRKKAEGFCSGSMGSLMIGGEGSCVLSPIRKGALLCESQSQQTPVMYRVRL